MPRPSRAVNEPEEIHLWTLRLGPLTEYIPLEEPWQILSHLPTDELRLRESEDDVQAL